MPKLHVLQTALNGGEVAPALRHRTDLAVSQIWLKEAKNMIVHPQGGVSNRAGTHMLAQAKNANVRLIPFEFSNENTYVLEFGAGYIRFYTPQGQIITQDGEPYEIATPFEDVWKLRVFQSADVMYIAWGGKPQKLTRYGHADWTLTEYEYKNGPYDLQNTDEGRNMAAGYDSQNNKFYLYADFNAFSSEDAGRAVKINYAFDAAHLAGKISNTDDNYLSGRAFAQGQYVFKTHGTWQGTIKVQCSQDLTDWKIVREFESSSADESGSNYDHAGSLEEGMWWVRVAADITNGTVYYSMDTQNFSGDLQWRILETISQSQAQAQPLDGIAGVEELISPQGTSTSVLKDKIVPALTSNTTPYGKAYSASLTENAYLLFTQMNVLSAADYMTFGYEPESAYYVRSMSFYAKKTTDGKDAEFTLQEAKEALEVSYSLNDSASQLLNVTVKRGEEEFEVVADFGQYVLSDNLFVKWKESSSAVSLGKVNFAGYKYEAGKEPINLSAAWAMGAWSGRTGYPTDVCGYQDRVFWFKDNRADASKIGQYQDFGVSENAADDDAVSITLADEKINKITAVASGGKLVLFTATGNHVHNQTTFTPSTATFSKDSEEGAGEVAPVTARGSILYASVTRGLINDFNYDYQVDGYKGDDITLLAKHLFKNKKVKEMAYQAEPDSQLWVVLDSGELLCCTYLKGENVKAWSHMETAGKVLSVCVLYDGNYQNVYLAVERATGTFVEKMPVRLLSYEAKDQFFVDCGRTYEGEAAAEITGLSYLEGQEVVVLADGNVQARKTVQNGKITLDLPAQKVQVGLPYSARIKTLPADVGQADGTAQDRKRRLVAATVFFTDSRGGLMGTDNGILDPILQTQTQVYNGSAVLADYDKRMTLSAAHGKMPSLVVQQDDPLPITVTGFIQEMG